ncbi:MAG TPA: hypothetical protein VEZ14_04320 [Dehalococcoidia bacterium]|nr:hypothetical protein [Dehalococcoidia bacterium]
MTLGAERAKVSVCLLLAVVATIIASCSTTASTTQSRLVRTATDEPRLSAFLLEESDLTGTWIKRPSVPLIMGVGPCDPQTGTRPYIAEADVAFQAGSARLVEAIAKYSPQDASRVLANERTSLASCAVPAYVSPWPLSLGDESVGYTQQLQFVYAAIAVVRKGDFVVLFDYVDSRPTDLIQLADLAKKAVSKLTLSGGT